MEVWFPPTSFSFLISSVCVASFIAWFLSCRRQYFHKPEHLVNASTEPALRTPDIDGSNDDCDEVLNGSECDDFPVVSPTSTAFQCLGTAAITNPVDAGIAVSNAPIVSTASAADLKQAGNVAMAAGRSCEALELYSASLAFGLEAAGCEVFVAALGNRAACFLELGRWAEAEADASETLSLTEHSSTKVKAFARRAMAREHIGRIVDALGDIEVSSS